MNPSETHSVAPWDVISSEQQDHYRIFSVHTRRARSPESGTQHDFYVIEAPDWVNVVPVTPGGQLVFIRQYRPGTDEVTLEIPGGMVDPGDASPAEAARRELREETGYRAEALIDLGAVDPNPAIQSNRCYTYLAPNARKHGPQQLDGTEEVEVTLVAPGDVPGLITGGQITHALVVAAFYLYDQYRKRE